MKRFTISCMFILFMVIHASAQNGDVPGGFMGPVVDISNHGENFRYFNEETSSGKNRTYYKLNVSYLDSMLIKLDCSIQGNASYEFCILDEQLNQLKKTAGEGSLEYICTKGTYYVFTNIYGSNLSISTSLRGYTLNPGTKEKPVKIGRLDPGKEYVYPFDTSLFTEDRFSPGPRTAEWFIFYLEENMEVNFTTIGILNHPYEAKLEIFDAKEKLVFSIFNRSFEGEKIILPQGRYYMSVQGEYGDGEIELRMKGASLVPPEEENNCKVQYQYNPSGHRTRTIQKP